MNPNTHRTEKMLDDFCREVVQSARASDEEIQAAAQAPFLYQRLRAQIAAEQNPIVAVTPQRTGFLAALAAWPQHWRWSFAATAAGAIFLVFAGWHFWPSTPTVVPVAKQAAAPPVTAPTKTAPEPERVSTNETEQVATATPTEDKPSSTATRPTPRPASRPATETRAEETELTTDFMPLTYAGDREDEGGQIVRMEVPREALIALGIPMAKDLTSERIRADIKLGDDGVALAIRLISDNNE